MDPSIKQTNNPVAPNKFKLSFDLRVVVVLLLILIAGMLYTWRPWAATPSTDGQIIEVTGEAKLTDTPDEFVFYPSYQFKNTNKEAALADLTKKSNEVVAKLKALGVPDKKIKTDSNNYDTPVYIQEQQTDDTYSLQLTVTVGNNELAQKVQDYLITTSPSGAISPQASFSDEKRKTLESKARDEATKDARKKADQMAANLGFKLGKLKSVSDNQGFDILPLGAREGVVSDSVKTQSLNIQPGENDLNYSVHVIYYID